jgi:hypothetical protein
MQQLHRDAYPGVKERQQTRSQKHAKEKTKMTNSYFTVRGAGLAVLLATIAMVDPRQVHAQQPPLPVTVTNGITRPVPMFGTDNPAFQPFQHSAEFSTSVGVGSGFITITTVPAGKRLVIEFVSVDVFNFAGSPVHSVYITTTTAGVTTYHRFVLFGQGLDAFGNGVSAAAQQVRLYADPGTTVSGSLTRSGSVGTAEAGFHISGYFVDLPRPVDITP